MTWQEFAIARQLVAEERVGKAAREVIAQEDAIFEANKKAHQRMKAAK